MYSPIQIYHIQPPFIIVHFYKICHPQFISHIKHVYTRTPTTGLVLCFDFCFFLFCGGTLYHLWPNLRFTLESRIMNVDIPVWVQNRFSRNVLQAHLNKERVQRRSFQCNIVTVADPFDQAACQYRMIANTQGELLFQINESYFSKLDWHACRLYLKMELSPRCLKDTHTPPFTIWAWIYRLRSINV